MAVGQPLRVTCWVMDECWNSLPKATRRRYLYGAGLIGEQTDTWAYRLTYCTSTPRQIVKRYFLLLNQPRSSTVILW